MEVLGSVLITQVVRGLTHSVLGLVRSFFFFL